MDKRHKNRISEALIQANIAKAFLRLALAINGLTEHYNVAAFAVKEFDHNLPTFVTTDFCSNENIRLCSSRIRQNEKLEENVAYSDDIYGHLWFTKQIKYQQVKIIC